MHMLSSGTYGIVYRARLKDENNNNSQVVALKKIKMGERKDGGVYLVRV